MLTGHASHQIGLDADIWLTPMPANLTPEQRETMSAVDMVRPDGLAVDPNIGRSARRASSARPPRSRR